jgi:DNA-binding MarR family transcriptional regulator
MALLPDISATTLHRRLKTLRTKGFISMDMDDVDNRVKYVVPTPMADEYFAKLSKSLDEAGKEFDQRPLQVKLQK